MTHYLIKGFIITYWLLSGLLLFYFVRSEEFGQANKPSLFVDLGISLIIGGLVTPILIGATTVYFVARGRN